MTQADLKQALEAVYTSLANDNEGIDTCIADLKKALATAGQKTATIDTARIAKNNREGRKRLEAYFRQRGVIVEFSK